MTIMVLHARRSLSWLCLSLVLFGVTPPVHAKSDGTVKAKKTAKKDTGPDVSATVGIAAEQSLKPEAAKAVPEASVKLVWSPFKKLSLFGAGSYASPGGPGDPAVGAESAFKLTKRLAMSLASSYAAPVSEASKSIGRAGTYKFSIGPSYTLGAVTMSVTALFALWQYQPPTKPEGEKKGATLQDDADADADKDKKEEAKSPPVDVNRVGGQVGMSVALPYGFGMGVSGKILQVAVSDASTRFDSSAAFLTSVGFGPLYLEVGVASYGSGAAPTSPAEPAVFGGMYATIK